MEEIFSQKFVFFHIFFFPRISCLPLSLLQRDSQHSEVLCTLTVPLLQNRFLTEKLQSVHLLCTNALSLQAVH